MSKQTSLLDNFLTKKKNDSKKTAKKTTKNHPSSRENSVQTQKLSNNESDQVKLQVFDMSSKHHDISTSMVCPQLILITPSSLLQFPTILRKMQKIQKHYSKQDFIGFIEGNLRYHQIQNVKHLQQIDDDTFWSVTAPQLLFLVIQNIKKIENKIRMLYTNSVQVIELTRLEILVILSSMFFGIMPKQFHTINASFGELMIIRQNQYAINKINARFQKLKCIIAYFNIIVQHEGCFNEVVNFQRTTNKDTDYLNHQKFDHQMPLRNVTFQHLKNKSIQDYFCKALMIDFANKKIGGGVLRNGCVQQQILFTVFPEAIISLLICDEMEDNQAIIIYGARRFSKYSGYSDGFTFEGEYPFTNEIVDQKSVLIAIDAIDFSKVVAPNYQYSKKGVRRQINKAFAGFEGACFRSQEDMPVCTGKWGCGAFKGDEDMKFLIQWISCSQAKRQMIYITDREQKIKELTFLTQQLYGNHTLDLLNILDQYYKFRVKAKQNTKFGILDYIKQFAI